MRKLLPLGALRPTCPRARVLLILAAALAAACTATTADPGDGTGPEGKADGWGTSANGKILVLRGTVVTMDESRGSAGKQILDNAAVVIKGEKIDRILLAGEPLPTGSNVVVLPSKTGTSDWVITPGLINAHNHLAYNTAQIYRGLPLYENTYQWRDEDYYDEHIQLPKRLFGSCSADVDELGAAPDDGDRRVELSGLIGRYAEAKELLSGTTATQGSYFGISIHTGYGNHLARNMDGSNFGKKRVSQESLGILVGSFDPRELIARMDSGKLDAWLVHLAEGTDQESADEFECLEAMGLVRRELAIIHGIALTPSQLQRMGAVGAKLIASPLDNLLYYGRTADLPAAWRAGVKVAIGTDWTPAGSKNLLVELKVLDMLNQQIWNGFFSNRDMIAMVTTNPADAIGWTGLVGRLKPGMYADVAVYARRNKSAYRAIIEATEKDMRLVLVGGDPLAGDADLMAKLKPTDSELVHSACGFDKAIDLTSRASAVQHGDITLAQTTDFLSEALQFDFDWIHDHLDDARTGNWSPAQTETWLENKFDFELEPRELNSLFACEDSAMLEEIRTDANVRTAYSGVCLDLRKYYGGQSGSSCGTMPAHPDVLTTAEHDGTLPERPPAWCAEQDWFTSGPLPKP